MTPTTIGPDSSWRLVHDGKDVMALFESGGYTTTIHNVFEAQTRDECLAEIERLGLVYEAQVNQPG